MKLEGIVAEILGNASEEMRTINSLATDPGCRRRGYGGALVDFVTSLSDAEGRATYLLSSNPVNTDFYNSRGFVEFGKVIIGEGNPTWKEPPLPILLVCVTHFRNGDSQTNCPFQMVRPFDPNKSL